MQLTSNKSAIQSLTFTEFSAWLKNHNMPVFRLGQILRWIYLRQVDDFEKMTDLGKTERILLGDHFFINRLKIIDIAISKDGTRKYLFGLSDGKLIESVVIPEKDHYTLCISSQAGCAQGCRFCLTARGGFERNLMHHEIVGQVRDILADLAKKLPKEEQLPVSNIVFMGMGEPLANYQAVITAIDVLTHYEFGLKFANRRITVSTCGLVSRLADLGRDTQVNLAVSLNATTNEIRNRIMPINKIYPIEKLIGALRDYPLKKGNRITFEYILIHGVNDSTDDALRLVRLLSQLKSKINLIPYNAFGGSEFKTPSMETVLRFQDVLLKKNCTAIIRKSKGRDILAACGQLRSQGIKAP